MSDKTLGEVFGIPEHLSKHSTSGWRARCYRWIIFIAFMLMGLGNWADTKSLLTEGYEAFVAHFTNWTEERTIAAIDVGNYLPYAEQKIGIPQVIKTSAIDRAYEYRYYKNRKYLLTLIVKGERVSAVIVHSLPFDSSFINGFSPTIPLGGDHLLGVNSIEEVVGSSNEYFFDAQNLLYFMMARQLGNHHMNLYLLAGFSEYEHEHPTFSPKAPLTSLDSATLQDDAAQVSSLVQKLAQAPASFYAISELEGQFVADALLTRFEFDAYF